LDQFDNNDTNIEDNYDETLDNLTGSRPERIRKLIVLILRLTGFNSKPMKAVIYGPSSRSYDQTYLILKQLNMYGGMINRGNISPEVTYGNPRIYDKLYFTYNYFILNKYYGNNVDVRGMINELDMSFYITDPNISATSKKKILIMLLYHGLINNPRQWTGKTGIILHQWIVRQRRYKNKWKGDFHLKLQQGENIMEIVHKRNPLSYEVFINSTQNSMTIKKMFDRACELLQKTNENLFNKLKSGNFVISDHGINQIANSKGKRMIVQRLDNIIFYPGEILIDENFITLLDENKEQIMKTPLGLMATDYSIQKEDIYNDFLMNGVSFLKLAKLKIFSYHFDFSYVEKSEILDTLDDLEVPKPKLSSVTKTRCGLPNDWEERDVETDFKILEEEIIEQKVAESQMFDEDEFISELMDTEVPTIEQFEKNIFDDFDIGDLSYNLISQLQVTKKNIPTTSDMGKGYSLQGICNNHISC